MAEGTYGVPVEFSVLGPLRVDGADGRVEIRGLKERLLLGVLLAHAGRTVPVADLVDALWDEQPPRTAAKSLQTYVLRLRNALEPDRDGAPRLLVTEGQGYRLAVDPRRVDAARFERLLQAAGHGPPRERLALLGEALDLWRGRAYADLGTASALAAEATRLEELRVQAVADRLAAELDLGRHASVVGELERLVADHPLRERFWELLVTALYRDGRQGDALTAYERARAVLSDELGLDPGERLRDLHLRVLAQDPDLLHRGSPLPAALRPGEHPLRGRDAELEALRAEWSAATSGRRTVWVRAPVGGGARSLVATLAESLAHDGVPVAYTGARGGGEATGLPSGGVPTLVVHERVADGPVPERGLLVVITDPHAAPPESCDRVIDLAPLGVDAVRAVLADQLPADEVTSVLAELGAGDVGVWPGRVHAAMRSHLRRTVRAVVATAASDTQASLARLQEARQRLVEGVLDLQESDVAPTPDDRCPWPGLAPYDVADGPRFAGRERLVAELVARTSGSSFLAVVGASGSGKSSAVRAGLLAALAADALPGSAGWTTLVMRPGAHPLRELAHRVLGARRPETGAILEQLLRHGESADRTLLVVDQCEEVWTACDDEAERTAFLDTLAGLAGDPSAAITVVVVLRADFLDRVADHPELAALVSADGVLVGTPTPDEVRRAVERPAAAAGLTLDVGLADALVADAGAEPGLLPLLSTSLAQLWAAREGARLTFAGYVASGGLRGAIGHLAERAFDDLTVEEREVARTLLLRLTGPGDGVAVTRRRVAMNELEGLPGDVPGVVARLADARLLTVSGGHVEVSHEALFREWPRLRGWLTEDAAGRAVQRRLAIAAGEWEGEGRDPALLWRGTRLESGTEVAALRPAEVSDSERAFLEAAVAQVDWERRDTVRQNRRLKLFLLGTAALLVVALLAGVLAMVARGQAGEAAARARAQAVVADARRLAASALNVDYPDLALLTAVEATRLEQSPETYGALLTLLARQPDVVTRFRTPDRFLRNAVSPDGETVFVSENGGVLRALDAETGDLLWNLDEGLEQIGSLAPSPDGQLLAATVFTPPAGELVLLDPDTGAVVSRHPMAELRGRRDEATDPYLWSGLGWVGPDRLVVASDARAYLLDRRGRVTGTVPWGQATYDTETMRVWSDGTVSTGPALDENGLVLDLRSGRTRTVPGTVRGVGVQLLVVSSETVAGGTFRLHDRRSLAPVSPRWPLDDVVQDAAFSADGTQLAVAAGEQVLLRDARTGAPDGVLEGHSGVVMGLEYAGAAGDLLWTAGRDGSAVGFDVSGRRGVISQVPRGGHSHAGEAVDGWSVWTDSAVDRANLAYLLAPGDRRGRALPLTGLEDCLCQAASVDLTSDGARALVGVQIFTRELDERTDLGHLVVHDTATREVEAVVDLPWPVLGIDATPDGSRAVVQSATGVAVVDLESREVVGGPVTLPHGLVIGEGVGSVEVSPDGERAALFRDEGVVIVDSATARVLAQAPLWDADADEPVSGAWTPDGRRLLVGSLSGWRYVLDPETLESVVPRRLIAGGFVIDSEISPDGTLAATLGSDGDVLLWDTASWRPYGEPVLDGRGWGFLAFADDSRTLTVTSEETEWVEVVVRPADWIAAACAAANRDLTVDESAVVRPGEPWRPTCD